MLKSVANAHAITQQEVINTSKRDSLPVQVDIYMFFQRSSSFVDTFLRKIRRRKETPSTLAATLAVCENQWIGSLERNYVLNLIEKRILTNPRFEIDSALCLGLESMSGSRLEQLKFPRLLSVKSYDDDYMDSDMRSLALEEEEDRDYVSRDCGSNNDGIDAESVAYGGTLWNISLYQLLLYETVLESLRK